MNLPSLPFSNHYPTRAEKLADGWVHGVGLAAAVAGAIVLIVIALVDGGSAGLLVATGLYCLCLIAMLSFSAIYNLNRAPDAKPILRQLDEAGILLMIAGSYTPFTTQRFEGGWAIGMTALVWTVALAGVVGKLSGARIPDKAWTLLYVAFGWLIVVAIKPLVTGVPMTTLILLVAGGLIYTTGALIYHSRLPFRRAIWHGFVVTAAAAHFAAICIGVVLAAPVGAMGT